jgi:hypothetical protein
MKLLLVKQFDNSFKVAYESDFEKLKKIKAGEFIECEIKKKRNIKFHRKFFALINLVYQNQETYNNIDHLRNDLTIASGYYTQRTNLQGEVITEPKSISFASMDEHSFSEYYNKVLDAIVKYFNFDKQLIIDNVEQHF